MIDRRVRRTRLSLQTALISLIPERGYDAVTVEEICEAADVGRSTFYAHYKSKDDLKRRAIDDHLRGLFHARQLELTAAGGAERSLSATQVIFEHVRDHRDLCRAVVRGPGCSVAIDAIRNSLSALLREEIGSGSSSSFMREFTVQYLVGAFITVLVWWLDNGARRSPEEMESHFRELSTKGTMSALGGGSAAERG